MIDEFQEIGLLPPKKRFEINGFMHKLFDNNPNFFNLFLSFTTGDKDTVQSLLGDALKDRISNFIEIPEMNSVEACEFLEKLIEIHASPNNPGLYPFVKSGIESIVDHVENSEKFLIPRELIKAADKVLSEADILIDDGDLKEIDGEFVKNELLNNDLDSE